MRVATSRSLVILQMLLNSDGEKATRGLNMVLCVGLAIAPKKAISFGLSWCLGVVRKAATKYWDLLPLGPNQKDNNGQH